MQNLGGRQSVLWGIGKKSITLSIVYIQMSNLLARISEYFTLRRG